MFTKRKRQITKNYDTEPKEQKKNRKQTNRIGDRTVMVGLKNAQPQTLKRWLVAEQQSFIVLENTMSYEQENI